MELGQLLAKRRRLDGDDERPALETCRSRAAAPCGIGDLIPGDRDPTGGGAGGHPERAERAGKQVGDGPRGTSAVANGSDLALLGVRRAHSTDTGMTT